ncbi:MAG: hypothetical protein SFZ03_08740 [Candidatus Melainabacteria bacterium]|nr:hypothetical protein [Candidatus Melainabacteria bacterium]
MNTASLRFGTVSVQGYNQLATDKQERIDTVAEATGLQKSTMLNETGDKVLFQSKHPESKVRETAELLFMLGLKTFKLVPDTQINKLEEVGMNVVG